MGLLLFMKKKKKCETHSSLNPLLRLECYSQSPFTTNNTQHLKIIRSVADGHAFVEADLVFSSDLLKEEGFLRGVDYGMVGREEAGKVREGVGGRWWGGEELV